MKSFSSVRRRSIASRDQSGTQPSGRSMRGMSSLEIG
jgi:hypothetical protein